jgi:hypothetical protein
MLDGLDNRKSTAERSLKVVGLVFREKGVPTDPGVVAPVDAACDNLGGLKKGVSSYSMSGEEIGVDVDVSIMGCRSFKNCNMNDVYECTNTDFQ